MTDAITPWVHVVAVTVWLGPQFFLFLAAIPAVRTIEDQEVRLRVIRVISRRFGWLALAALAVIVLSGMSNLFQVGADTGIDLWSTDFRYFHLFSAKMAVLGLAVLLTTAHVFILGPRLLRLQEEASANSTDVARLRAISVAVSGLGLLASIAVVYLGILVSDHAYSFQPR